MADWHPFISKERRDEICNEYIMYRADRDDDLEELITLHPTELSLLYQNAIYAKENFIDNGNFDNRIALFYKAAVEKIKKSDMIYVLYCKITNMPLIDCHYNIWVFTYEECTKKAAQEYLGNIWDNTKDEIEFRKFTGDEVIEFFAKCYINGMVKIALNEGGIIISLADIVAPPDFSDVPSVSRPVMNPDLKFYLILFCQICNTSHPIPEINKLKNQMYNAYMDCLLTAKLLRPAKISSETISSENGVEKILPTDMILISKKIKDKEAWPAYTDWEAFPQELQDEGYSGIIEPLEGVLEHAKSHGFYVVINPNRNGILLYEDEITELLKVIKTPPKN
ncbi:MAG: hypothetical protein GYA50_00655 [Eubacteriaceae bacterium]|nr:hypothetical protein [Eubacteriaceae bacterium]